MLIQQPGSRYDVLIAGGGMVGASFALDLAHSCQDQSLSIGVVETVATTDHDSQPSFDARSTALAWSSRGIYEAMGLWGKLDSVVTPIKRIEVSDQGRFGVTHLHHQEQSVAALGYVIENRNLGAVLNEALLQSSVIELLAPASIVSVSPQPEGMELVIRSSEADTRVTAELLVLADGGRSPICRQLGIEHSSENYRQCAVITNIAVQNAHQNVAYERFTESGPLAVLPLQAFEGQQRCSVVWTVEAGADQALLNCKEAGFIDRLAKLFGNRSGRIEKIGQRFSYPLVLTEAKEQIRPRLVLLGNVAHTLHPVAGQGLNLALRDSACLSRTVGEAIKHGQAPGSMAVLQDYLDQQASDQRRSIYFTDQMTRLFSSPGLAKVLTRKTGLLSLDLIPALRQEFTRRAMGL